MLPTILFLNINGVGLGHMSTCLAYALRLRGRARPVFFSLASAVDMIHTMGFEADYFVSPSWSSASIRIWNQQLRDAQAGRAAFEPSGAEQAADEILALTDTQRRFAS